MKYIQTLLQTNLLKNQNKDYIKSFNINIWCDLISLEYGAYDA